MVQVIALSAVSAEVVTTTHSHNILFLLYFIMNIVDLLSGVCKAMYNGEYNSTKFFQGVIKKIARWGLVVVALVTYRIFLEVGHSININLAMTETLVWFVLSALTFQDIRSVFENLMVLGVEIPAILIHVLALAESKFGSSTPEEAETRAMPDGEAFDGDMIVDTTNPAKDVYRLELNIPVEMLSTKERIVLQVKRADNPTHDKTIF